MTFLSSTTQWGSGFCSYESTSGELVQRYYGVGVWTFYLADPYQASSGAAIPGSWNRYSYTHGDPVNFVDPTGRLEADPSDYQGSDGDPYPCGPNWMWDASLQGPCTGGGGGGIGSRGAGGGVGDGLAAPAATSAICGPGITSAQCDALVGYDQFYLLAPTPSALDALLNAKIASGAASAVVIAILNPTPMGNGSFPTSNGLKPIARRLGNP